MNVRAKLFLVVFAVLLFGGSWAVRVYFFDATGDPDLSRRGKAENASHPEQGDLSHPVYERIVSMSPSVTEILFSLDLGERVVGVTEFCDFPPEAAERDKIGGYFNPNYEAIVALEPDLVVMLIEHAEARRALAAFDIDVLSVNHQVIDGILESIERIGETCGVVEQAEVMRSRIEGRIETIRDATRDLDRPSVLISVGRPLGTGTIREVYVAGREGFFDLMIDWAGGKNAFQGDVVKYPLVSAEGILTMNPQVILDISAETETMDLEEGVIRAEWDSVPEVDAVKHDRVHVLGGDYVGIPGPRFVLTLERIARAIHPAIDWDERL